MVDAPTITAATAEAARPVRAALGEMGGHVKAAATSGLEAAKAGGASAVDAAKNVNSRLASSINRRGVWGSMTHAAGKYPLVVGAGVITAAALATYKMMGPSERAVRERAMSSQRIER